MATVCVLCVCACVCGSMWGTQGPHTLGPHTQGPHTQGPHTQGPHTGHLLDDVPYRKGHVGHAANAAPQYCASTLSYYEFVIQ